MIPIKTISSSQEYSSENAPCNEKSPVQQAAASVFKEACGGESKFQIKVTLSRMIVKHHPLDFMEDDGDIQDIFCDETHEGLSYLELALQVRYVAAVRLLKDYNSKFIPQLPQYVLMRCEELMQCDRFKELEDFKEHILELSRGETLESLSFLRYFLTRHQSIQSDAAFNFYRDVLWTLMRMHMITFALVKANLDFGKTSPASRSWYARVLGLSEKELIPPSICLIQ